MERFVCLILGYICGLFQTGYIYGRLHHIDIRKHGSGNAGTTNALRTLGWKAGAVTFLGDSLKCVLAVAIAYMIYGKSHNEMFELLAMYAGIGAVLGHNFPFYLNFKGEKSASTSSNCSTNAIPFSMPNRKHVVDKASPWAEVSDRMVTEARPVSAGNPV